MADFSVSDVASRVKGPEGMSLADMMNMAIGAQKYKQAEKINPLLERQQGAITTEAEETLQPKISRTKAEAQRSVYEADKAGVDLKQHYANIGKGLFGGFLTDPDFINGNADKMIAKIQGAQNYAETVLGVPKEILSNSDRIVDMIKKNPSDGYQYIKNGVLQSGQNQAQTNLVTPRIENINGVPYSYTPAGNVAVPAGVNPNQPQVQPNAPMVQPQQNITSEDMNKPVYSQKAPLTYPVRKAGEPYAPGPTEKVDQDAGVKNRNILVDRQSNLTTDRRNLIEAREVAKELEKEEWAKGAGFMGMAGRNLSTFLGTEMGIKYKQLSKDLANVQISNIQAKGGSIDTVAGQQLTRMANGDETYPPKVLLNIISRAQADMTELDLKATAAQKFSQKFGDNNFKAFQQMWSKNADSKIFELYNISKDPDLSAKEKEAAKAKLFPKNEKERKVFVEKYLNIKKLEETGSL
jgi:ribosomal protein S24E